MSVDIENDTKSFIDYKICQKFVSLHQRANSKDIPFDLTFAFLKRLMTRKTCQYTGVRFDDEENKLSIERVDSNKGYTQGNVLAVSERINKAKNNFTYKELKLILQAIEKHQEIVNEK